MISGVVFFGTPQYDVLRAEINELMATRMGLRPMFHKHKDEYRRLQTRIVELNSMVRFKKQIFVPIENITTPISDIKRPLSNKEKKDLAKREKITKSQELYKSQQNLF